MSKSCFYKVVSRGTYFDLKNIDLEWRHEGQIKVNFIFLNGNLTF